MITKNEWEEIRHNIINRTTQMGLHARRASVLLDKTAVEHEKIMVHINAIMEKAREIDDFFTKRENANETKNVH